MASWKPQMTQMTQKLQRQRQQLITDDHGL